MVGRAPIFARCVWVVGETSDMSSSRGGAQFREKREGGGGEGEGEGVSPSNFLTRGSTCALRVASFERPIPRRWNLFFFFLTVYLHIGSQPKSKISNRSFHPIGLDGLAKLK